MRSLAIQKPGWIINRHAVRGAPHVWPEIRPDGLVRTGPPTLHWHGTGEVPEFPNKGYRILPHGDVAWADHCRRVNDNDLERVMNSIRNGLGMRETESAREPSRL
jgi:hypothetical protein